jgi:CheY-like chemotaxis protein
MSQSGRTEELGGVHVLVVDDDPDSLEMMRAALSYAGALVTAVDSAQQAFTALNRVAPDVIVSDLRMPGADGLSFARELKTMPALRSVPVLAVTGYDELYARSELHAAGFIGILRKPLAFLDLVRTVAALADAGGVAER